MTLADVVDAASRRRKSLVHFAPEPGAFAAQFDARNVDVDFRRLPEGGPDPFVAVYEAGEFVAAVTVADLRAFLEPPSARAFDRDALPPAHRALFDLFDDTVFASLTRRQLLATAREIEDRAWRTGRGELHAGFQSLAAFEAQRPVYRRLAAGTRLDVHVYVVPSADTDALDESPVTVHASPSSAVGRYWFVVFDGGGTDQQSALVAEQRGENDYYGAWTYEPEFVDAALAAVRGLA
ncbi:DICT sensory domain-containing protein [Halobacterium litoreum]|uniref:DICT sensory domain-containing protein n=1 Tax=Halobacterium litoreum TaxID=2039234 RepID=A0ABD5NFH2_9EURY|nr:DICT sensory domain-containing protein [Halobacterium litoreum]UHH13167.1 sensor protein [Halobacterium litoreum]